MVGDIVNNNCELVWISVNGCELYSEYNSKGFLTS